MKSLYAWWSRYGLYVILFGVPVFWWFTIEHTYLLGLCSGLMLGTGAAVLIAEVDERSG